MQRTALLCLFACAMIGLPAEGAGAQSLDGSPRSIERQNQQARRHDFTFLGTGRQVHRFVQHGFLVPLRETASYEVSGGVSYPYVRPEVELFLERLGRQYRAACGRTLVVTSATRPRSRQPRNASTRSVHPTGMAVDLRKSTSRLCQRWLERVLLDLERGGYLEATEEHYPPHYHVAVYPTPYQRYVLARRGTVERVRVRRGDTLWGLAREHGTSVKVIQRINKLQSSRIMPGQILNIPAG